MKKVIALVLVLVLVAACASCATVGKSFFMAIALPSFTPNLPFRAGFRQCQYTTLS